MSIKTQLGEIVDAMVREGGCEVDVYTIKISTPDNYKEFSGKGYIENTGDLLVDMNLSPSDFKCLFDNDTILNEFTQEELKSYLEENYD